MEITKVGAKIPGFAKFLWKKKKMFFYWGVWGPLMGVKPLLVHSMGLGEFKNHKNLIFDKVDFSH